MKLHTISAILALAGLLAACEKKGPPIPLLRGADTTPFTNLGKPGDRRYVEYACGSCGQVVAPGTDTCKNTIAGGKDTCMAVIEWPDKFRCPSCFGSGRCRACVFYGAEEGKCWKCGGAGWTGLNVICPNCYKSDSDYGKCPVCAGSQKCDWCAGTMEGEVSVIARAKLEEHSKAKLAPVESGGVPAPAPTPVPAEGTTPPAETGAGATPPPAPAEGAAPPAGTPPP
jgi:hypothetical protein